MKQHIEHIERASLISWMRIVRLNSVNATILILQSLYKIFTKPHMDYACTPLTALSKSQRQKLEVTQNRCFHYARRAVDSTYISNNELCSRCNIVSVEQRILPLANTLWKKASKNNDDIINFTITKQTTEQKRFWILSKVTGSSDPATFPWFYNLHVFTIFSVTIFSTTSQTQVFMAALLTSSAFSKIKNRKVTFRQNLLITNC